MSRVFILYCMLLQALLGQSQVVPAVKPAVEDDEFQYILKANLLSPFVGTATVHFEVNQNPNSSSQFELFYFGGQYFGEPTGVNGLGGYV